MVIDCRQRVIAPGLIDAHVHLLLGGQSLDRPNLCHVRSRQEFEAAIDQAHRSLPPDQWLIAAGWSQENWPGGSMPDKSWLDAAADRPTVCYRMDMHAAVVNDVVLRMIKGAEHRGGLLVESALWEKVNPLVPKPTVQERRRFLRRAQAHAHAKGLTAVGSMEYARDVHDVYEPLRDALTLSCRITLLDRDWPLDVRDAMQFQNDGRLAIIGFKTFIDGTLGSRTARMLQEYADDPGNRGMLMEHAASGRLVDWISLVARHGLSPSMHAIGDEAVRIALDAIDSFTEHAPRARVEHAQHVDPVDLPRFHGRIASMQPLHKADDGRYLQRRLGPSRSSNAFAFRGLLDAGAVLAFGSDWPVVSCDPLLGIRAAVTGLTSDGNVASPEQNISVEESLRAYTSGAACALGLEGAGVLRVGALADLVMFDRDPLTADWTHDPPRVCLTVANGRIVYDAAHAEPICAQA